MARAPKQAASRGARSSTSRRTPAPRRPPEVPAKDWRGYSASYRKRLATFYRLHPGASRQQARGKKAGEHVTRKTKLEARMAAVAARQSYRGGNYGSHSASELVASYQRIVRDHGETAFTKIERMLLDRHHRWTDAGSPYAGAPAALDLDPSDAADYDIDWDWEDYDIDDADLFYH